jgi:hypothetical protein
MLIGAAALPLAAQEPKPGGKEIDVTLTIDGIEPGQRPQIQFPQPETVSLTTPDGVRLSATFYGGVLGKKTPALILIHDLGGSSADLAEMAAWLQTNYGYASIVPDLRGHGNSPLEDQGDFDPEKISSAQFAAMGNDIEACKIYLRDQQNNAGLLNIDMLTLVGVGKVNVLAVEWSFRDWSFPPLAGKKQGQDVKNLVMISPVQSHKGSRMASLKAPLFSGKEFAKPLNVLIEVGSDDKKLLREAETIETTLKRSRKKEDDPGVYLAAGYSVNGAALAKDADVRKDIAELVFVKLYQRVGEFPWEQRGIK